MSDGNSFRSSTPIEEWPAWAREALDQGHIQMRDGVPAIKTHAGFHKCQRGDYVYLNSSQRLVVISAAVFERELAS